VEQHTYYETDKRALFNGNEFSLELFGQYTKAVASRRQSPGTSFVMENRGGVGVNYFFTRSSA